jgi:hypothetical protein
VNATNLGAGRPENAPIVERTTRFALSVSLRTDRKAHTVRDPIALRVVGLPEHLARSLTREGQGHDRACQFQGRDPRGRVDSGPALTMAARYKQQHERAAPAVTDSQFYRRYRHCKPTNQFAADRKKHRCEALG